MSVSETCGQDNVDTTLLNKTRAAKFRERGMFMVKSFQLWRRSILTELDAAATADDEAELDNLSLELRDLREVFKLLHQALDNTGKNRGDDKDTPWHGAVATSKE